MADPRNHTLQWYTFQGPLDGARRRLWRRILALVGWEGAAVLAATRILLELEFPIRHGRHDVVQGSSSAAIAPLMS